MPIAVLTDKLVFPPAKLSSVDGLLAIGGDLSLDRLILAYKSGIFPWYDDERYILWWSPDPRCVFFPHDFHISKSFKKFLKKQNFTIKFDHNFEAVIQNCAKTLRIGQTGTWILPSIVKAYKNLFENNLAHSVEVYDDKELVGGLYGVSLGKFFFAESMFFKKTNASKVALGALVELCIRLNFKVIDCQICNSHLKSLGAVEIARKYYLKLLEQNNSVPIIRNSWAKLAKNDFWIDLLD